MSAIHFTGETGVSAVSHWRIAPSGGMVHGSVCRDCRNRKEVSFPINVFITFPTQKSP